MRLHAYAGRGCKCCTVWKSATRTQNQLRRTVSRAWRIAMMAAMKKVLSPISLAPITPARLRVPSQMTVRVVRALHAVARYACAQPQGCRRSEAAAEAIAAWPAATRATLLADTVLSAGGRASSSGSSQAAVGGARGAADARTHQSPCRAPLGISGRRRPLPLPPLPGWHCCLPGAQRRPRHALNGSAGALAGPKRCRWGEGGR